MPFRDAYHRQAALLVRVLPHVAEEKAFALKGGTAINLFIRNMPRLSVDIDLTYLPVQERAASLAAIEAALRRITPVSDRIAALRQPMLGARSDSVECRGGTSLAEPRGRHNRLPARDCRWTIRLQRPHRGADVGQRNHTME
jgi:hypothetical protein